ncbi:MAG: histidine phosphatase family protein [Pyrinomonadaceae bacterium]
MLQRTLLLMRHAKASPTIAGVSDLARPLLAEGRSAAALLGSFIKREQLAIDCALSSPAVRARQTIDSVLEAAGLSLNVNIDQRLYEGGPHLLVEVLVEIDNDLRAVLLVGHNPVLEDLVHLLTGERVHLSPGTLTHLEVAATRWSEVGSAENKLRRVVRPKDLFEG